MDLLVREDAEVEYHDPHVPSFNDDKGRPWHSLPLSVDEIERADCVLILTNHSSIDYDRIVRHAKLVVDTRNATGLGRNGAPNVVML